jgi:drug/metabolite transporter (DMT)-like permease
MTPARAHALLHLTVLVWGLTAILGKAISMPALSLVFYRLIIVVIIASVRFRWQRHPWPSAVDIARFIAVGGLIAVHWACFYSCIKVAGVAVAVLCLSTIPFMTALITAAMQKRRPHATELVVGVLATVGVYLLLRFERDATAEGVVLGMLSAAFSAGFGSWNGSLSKQHAPAVITFFELAGALLWFPLFFLWAPHTWVWPSSIGPQDVGLLLVLAVLCTVLPWDWSLRVSRVLGAFAVALAVTLEPVYAILIAMLVFPGDEHITSSLVAGTVLIVALLWWNARLQVRRA